MANGIREAAIRTAFEALYFSGAHRLARTAVAGSGAILTFHRVLPASPAPFQPNYGISITPEFLELVLTAIRSADLDIVDLTEARRRLAMPGSRRFVVLTFDDGYRDSVEFALPVLERFDAPATLYVPSAFADGNGILWWLVMEAAIAGNASLELELGGATQTFICNTPEAKQTTFDLLSAYVRSSQTWDQVVHLARDLAARYDIDTTEQCQQVCLGWSELETLSRHPLVTLGAHTATHPNLAKLSPEAVYAEIASGVNRMTEMLGERPKHFAYPFGSPEAAGPREFEIARDVGLETAVTMRRGMLHTEHLDHLTALPRVSINGNYQRQRYISVLLSGLATALTNGFRRVNPA